MTGSEGERAVRLFVTFGQLLKLCSAIQNLTIKLPCGLRRIDLSLSQQLSNCAAGRWVNHLFYNTTTPIGVFESAKTCSGFHKHIRFENISPSFFGRFPVRDGTVKGFKHDSGTQPINAIAWFGTIGSFDFQSRWIKRLEITRPTGSFQKFLALFWEPLNPVIP